MDWDRIAAEDATDAFERPSDEMTARTVPIPSQTAKFSDIQRTPSAPSSSALEELPCELLHNILDRLDFQALSRLARASLRAKTIVESLPAYAELVQHAPDALAVLGHTRTIRHHSAAQLRAVLRSTACACGAFGPFLFLVTGERCCLNCIVWKPAFWAMPKARAMRCFGLSKQDVDQLPSLRSVPGDYEHGPCRRTFQLVSVKMAKARGLAVHGSMKRLRLEQADAWCQGRFVKREILLWDICLRDGFDLRTEEFTNLYKFRANPFSGMATTAFPSLSPDHSLERPIWCLGCHKTYYTDLIWTLRSGKYEQPNEDWRECTFMFCELERRAWSKAAFRNHLRNCGGAMDIHCKQDPRGPLKEAQRMVASANNSSIECMIRMRRGNLSFFPSAHTSAWVEFFKCTR